MDDRQRFLRRAASSIGPVGHDRIIRIGQTRDHGEPCVRGTRIAVSVLVASLADLSIDELLKQYPQLSREDIQAALHFASEAAHTTMVV